MSCNVGNMFFPGESLITLTGMALNYRQMWVSVRQDVLFKFRVRACHSVYLTLSGVIDTPERQTYEVEIGACYLTIVRERVSARSFFRIWEAY